MALNTWWDGESDQRYWMEIATEDVGQRLIAPKGANVWSYDLVSVVRPGDRVLHWKGQALVGWSEVIGSVLVKPDYTWQPRGTAGRALPGPRTTPGWTVTLGGLHPLTPPVTTATLQPLSGPLMDLRSDLEAAHPGRIYFPFYLYGGTRLRSARSRATSSNSRLSSSTSSQASTQLASASQISSATTRLTSCRRTASQPGSRRRPAA